jgi:hypothetical protein
MNADQTFDLKKTRKRLEKKIPAQRGPFKILYMPFSAALAQMTKRCCPNGLESGARQGEHPPSAVLYTPVSAAPA